MKPFGKCIRVLSLVIFLLFSRNYSGQCSLILFPTFTYNCVANIPYISLQISGTAPAPYTYTVTYLSNVYNGTTAISTGTSPYYNSGIYTATVVAANGCTVVNSTQVTPSAYNGMVVGSVTSTNVSCYGGSNGGAVAIPPTSFNLPPYTFSWMPGGMSTQTVNALSAGIIYSVTIINGNGCQVINTVSVTQPDEINTGVANTFITCYGGTLITTPTSTGGVAPYTYSLNGVSTGTNIALTAGTQSLYTKDLNGCVKINTLNITQSPPLSISFNYTSPSCPGKTDGSIVAGVSNGPAPYSYTWQPVNSGLSGINNITAGAYTLSVTDGSACITRSVANVAPATNMTANASSSPENCSASDGSFTVTINGGTPPYTYTTYPIMNFNNPISNISSGSYTMVIKDLHLCLDTLKFVVGNLSTVSLSISNSTVVSCYNTCNGSVLLNASNAVAPITYSASGLPLSTSNLIGNMCPGFYTIKATDANGCPATTTVNFPNPPFFTYSVSTPPTICYGKQSTLSAVASGGTGGYSYQWSPGNLSTQQAIVSPSTTSVYSLNVFDANGCTLSPFQVTVTVNPPISIVINSLATGVCPGSTAQITPTVTGGDGNYSYLWLPGNSNESSIFIENISIPTFTLNVNDLCGSPTAVQVIEIKLFDVKVPSFSVTANKGCEPFCTGFINTTPQSVTAIWTYGDTPSEQIGNITTNCYQKAGTYNVKLTVIDQNTCKSSFTQTNAIQVIAAPKVDFVTEPATISRSKSEQVLFKDASNDASSFVWLVEGKKWSTEENMHYTFPDTGCYRVKLIAKNADNCKDSIEKNICVLEDFNFYMPNVFTPNKDGKNDRLFPQGTGWNTDGYKFEIYNRWGHRIFNTNDVSVGWDGDYRENNSNATQPKADKENTYVWHVDITDKLGEKHRLNGSVIILR